MEVFVIVVVLAVGLFFVLSLGKTGGDRSSPNVTPIIEERPAKAVKGDQPARFDEKSAKHLDHTQVLVGAAYVTDGDTIKIKRTQIRLYGIDAPELNHPYGKKAKWALHKLCKGHSIRAEITDRDDYGRTVARCYLSDGRDLSAEMVKQGLAIDWPKFSGGKYRNLETSDARKKLFLADARQKGRMHVWRNFEARESQK